MKTKPLSARAALTQAKDEQAKKAKGMWRIWLDAEGPDSASEWLAAHIGCLWAETEDLRRRVRSLERKAKRQ